MTQLTIRHETRYTYERPVSFAPHRLLVRPRDSHANRILKATLQLYPAGGTRWIYDALGNCVCVFTPAGHATELTVVSHLIIARYPSPLEPLPVQNPHSASPIVYSHADRQVLGPFMQPAWEDDEQVLSRWIGAQMGRWDEPALDFLQRLNRAIRDEFVYNERQEAGVQSPSLTIRLGSGSCRDFAWLMIEALRRLGFAARYIMGYLYSPHPEAMRGAGATHAWCEVFLPALGWMEFDPTNGLAESADLIRVATVRTPDEAAPVSGSIIGDPGRSNLLVSVSVEQTLQGYVAAGVPEGGWS